jgi:hypothetical protein
MLKYQRFQSEHHMNPADIHLKFPDEATAISLMLHEGLLQKVKDQVVVVQGQMVDIIGLIFKPTGVMLIDDDGMEYAEMIDVGGWHVNIRGEVPSSIKNYVITVSGTPYRIWD